MRSPLGGEVLSFIDATELLQNAERRNEGFFGGSAPAIVSTDCKSLFSHLRKGASPAESLLNGPPLQLQTMMKDVSVDNGCLIERSGNPDDPLT